MFPMSKLLERVCCYRYFKFIDQTGFIELNVFLAGGLWGFLVIMLTLNIGFIAITIMPVFMGIEEV